MARHSRYTLLIICEGRNTEPFFFNSIRDAILDKQFVVEDMEIRIRPEPVLEDAAQTLESDLRPQRRKRQLLPARNEVEEEVTGRPPLKWVVAAQEELRDGTYNEVWVVFDDDDHPAKVEAFEKADELIEGKKVNIAYASIAFEYYLLLHFERINQAFRKSECRSGKVNLNCSSGVHEDDCFGKRCVGGYARIKGYWQYSKDRNSLYPIVENRLKKGFWNAAWLRKVSDIEFGDAPIYRRNPYVTTDAIVKRLTGFKDQHFDFVRLDEELEINRSLSIVFSKNLNFCVTNIGNVALIIPKGSLFKVSIGEEGNFEIGDRKILAPGQQECFVIAKSFQELEVSEFGFTFNNSSVILLYERPEK